MATCTLALAVPLTYGCSGSDDAASPVSATATVPSAQTTAMTRADRPFAVQKKAVTLVDTSRPTDDPIDLLDSPHRSLATDVYLPESTEAHPLIVLAHGRNGNPAGLSNLATTWASAGYVVAVPLFPLTHDVAPSASRIADYVNQPGDVSFVIDDLVRRSGLGAGGFSGRIDSERVGAAGISLGAATTYAVTFNSCCRDERIGAALLMAGYRFPFDGEYDLDGTPTLWIHGDADLSLPYTDSVEAYSLAAPPKILVTLLDGMHSEPFENDPDPHDDVVSSVTLDFWDAYLLGDDAAAERLAADGDVPGLATVDHEP